ncbi:M14 family zinc carboxypeptidase [Flavivirga eckloniae]|uniref:Uncharacterized protein n=1 Tax=Flavivirga eckloniae TaxID=1803846 RepID=A0A2K9PKN4_9FLAO|nr:M14 family zinc carboxypeptidase [Flavivirga eckloniae]AUP77592.1 hypothetical protein C1H87_02210 [Flavivirga eckloniae]
MKNNIMLMLLVYCTMSISLFAQKSNKELANEYLNLKGEVIFSFTINNKAELSTITKELAIVHFDEKTNSVKVMANKNQFSSFLQKNVAFTVISEDNIVGYRTMTSDLPIKATTFPLTAYPTYADYVAMMNDFATSNPSLCKVENIGATGEGDKSLLFVKLSDNVNQNEQEPRVMYTSSMHGDEIAGYPMMLNLIDYLLGAYKNTSHPKHIEIKNLLDNSEVWINPLANPDGTYRNSPNNTSVANATRGNANNVDLNRNYPDPDDGAHPDGNTYQTETIAFMNFADTKHFVLSANFHGGIELINYPWDTYAGAHPDEDYFLHISKEYRDHCQANSPSGYFDALNNGITNGYAWYEVQGGRQDYQIYNQKGREVTVELSNNKVPASNQLVNFWNYNRDALLAFLKQVNYGIHGVVTDAVTNQPIQAKVTVVGRESYDSWTPTELPEGDYYRPIKAGTYNVLYEAECYESLTLTGVTVADYAAVIKNVQLTPIGGVAPTGLTASNVQPTTATLSWSVNSGATYNVRYRVIGSSNWTTLSSNTNTINITGLIATTQYEAQVRSNCGGGASSPYGPLMNFTTTDTSITYCASKGTNVSDEYIDYVGLGGITNTTAANAGYGDFTNLVANIGTGTNTIVVSAGFTNVAYSEYWSVWIDYNQNGTFDTEEQIVSNLSNSSANQSFNFDVPATALLGNTRMRVSMKYSTASAPCETFTYGEVEDYSVNISTTLLSKGNEASLVNDFILHPNPIKEAEDYSVNISTTLLSKGNEPSLINDFILYPNPIKEGVLFIKNMNQKNVSFRIVNYVGQTIMKNQLSGDKINVARLSNGMYFLEVNTSNKTITKKFIITK